ncbi:MAG: hypothetical protein GXP08_02900 [Gammaproteobacteria bacterium]|nr:hypothetical protein [Gammaproteobacteria bacterium]
MTKRSTVRFLVFLFALFSTAQVSALSINFQSLNTTTNIGDTIDVDIVVSGLFDAGEIVSTYDLFVAYDASIVTASTVSFGPYLDDLLFPSIQFADTSNPGMLEFGEISFLFDDELAAIQPASFTLATLSFDAMSSGMSDLSFAPHPNFGVIDIKGRDAQILNVNAGVGTITVMAPSVVTVPEPDSLLLMLMGFVLLIISSHRFSFHPS